MSKQLKYKLKKTLKNAEFVHADLEYHQELSQDALSGFQEAIDELLTILTEEQRQVLKNYLDSRPRPTPTERPDERDQEEPPLPDYDDITALAVSDIEAGGEEHELPKINKELELKKLFRRIAEQTHPDKVGANGFSEKEITRLRGIFMRAREAHDNENWYILYSIATQLGLEIEEPTAEEIDWIEEDIKKTLGAIAGIARLSVWHWYIGDEETKKQVLRYYFLQVYDFQHPNL